MNSITLNAYAKINLSLEIIGRRPNGYHDIDSVMQGISLCDVITVSDNEEGELICSFEGVKLYMSSDSNEMPFDESNLAIKGLKAVIREAKCRSITLPEAIAVRIDKRLPVAAGIAGGSGNAAGAMLGANALLDEAFSLVELMDIGTGVGADVPFSILMNAARNRKFLMKLSGIEDASVSARATGIGEILVRTEPVKMSIIMANPGIGVSTKEVYDAIDSEEKRIPERGLFFNRMEEYTLETYPEASELKSEMSKHLRADKILMSGSGPTIVAYYESSKVAEEDYSRVGSWLKSGWRAWLGVTGEE